MSFKIPPNPNQSVIPVGSLLGQEPLPPSILPITQQGGQAPSLLPLLLIWDYPPVLLILRASSLQCLSRRKRANPGRPPHALGRPSSLSTVAGGDIAGGGGAGEAAGGGISWVYSGRVGGQFYVTPPGFLGRTGCK